MQKDYLDNKINLSLNFNTNAEENFEKVFSKVFMRHNNIEEDEEFEDKIYFLKNILLYKAGNLSYHFKTKNNDKFENKVKKINEEVFDDKDGRKHIDNLKNSI